MQPQKLTPAQSAKIRKQNQQAAMARAVERLNAAAEKATRA